MMLGMTSATQIPFSGPMTPEMEKGGWRTRDSTTRIPSSLAYDDAEGAFIAYGPEDYVRLRTHSNSDPFIGIPHPADQPLHLLNDPFGDLDEELPWLESFTDLTTYHQELDFDPCEVTSSIEQEIEKRATEVHWKEWDRFLREHHPREYQLSGRSSPNNQPCEEYIPNFALNMEYHQPQGQAQHLCGSESPIDPLITDDFLEDLEFLEPFVDEEKSALISPGSPPPQNKPKRGRPRLPKPTRTQKPKFSPIIDEDEDTSNPSDLRRRTLNRDAAFRYRERKKAQKEAIFAEVQELDTRNVWLKSRITMLSREIGRMKTHLEDMGAINP